ncbi:MAG: heavy metal translocating P-type ATPase [Clostridia bacterium]|nr:heavy metal translocating P-type ATPase [Clostridia bacterium]
MKKQFRLENMHCAGCANALEQKISDCEHVKVAKVNFITKILSLEIENEESEETINKVLETIKKFDRTIKISDPSEDKSAVESKKRKQKLLSIILSAVLFVLAFVLEKMGLVFYAYLPIYICSYILVAYAIIYKSLVNIIHGKVFDENFLMTVSTIGAFAISKFSEAVMVVLLYNIGELLEEIANNKSKNEIGALLDIKAKTANLITGDGEIVVDPNKVPIGSTIAIKPGENVPLDGIVLSGSSFVSTMAISGESAEKSVKEGDVVLSGTINGEGLLMLKTTSDDKTSTVSRIIDLVETATTKKANTEKFISKFAKWYTPVVCIIAVLLSVVPCLFVGFNNFSTYLYRGLVFLVASCPCALVISIPLSFFAGLGASARNGVLIKGGSYLEKLAKTKTVVFDKTGTLTEGKFEIEDILVYGEQSKEEILEFVAYAENYSNHQLAKSVVCEYLKNNEINGQWIEDIKEEPGLGISARIFMIDCLAGSKNLLTKNGVSVHEENINKTAIYLALNGEHVGTIILKDKIKEDSFVAVNDLNNIGITKIMMLTGDNIETAKEVASALNIKEFYANLLPEEKLNKLNALEKNGNIAFVGDGINDAVSLSSVDVGVSMGSVGSDVAINASDAIIVSDKPSKLASTILIARKTALIVRENILFALLIKLAVLALTAFGLGAMWMAVFADVGVSILAVLNSLRALKAPRKHKPKEKIQCTKCANISA